MTTILPKHKEHYFNKNPFLGEGSINNPSKKLM